MRLIEAVAERAEGRDAERLLDHARRLESEDAPTLAREICDDEQLLALVQRYCGRSLAASYDRELRVIVDRRRARFSTWYEMFPRSAADEPGRHGRLVSSAGKHGIETALDIAFQCSPDHPWVKGHPQWFRQRPDGTIQYAENPLKKYQDIYPFDFECADWRALWEELKSVFDFWIARGVRIFRVDNRSPGVSSVRRGGRRPER